MDEFTRHTLDSLNADAKTRQVAAAALASFDLESAAFDFVGQGTRMTAGAAVKSWVEMQEDEMEEGASLVDSFFGSLAAAVDTDGDGDLNDDEAGDFDSYVDAAWDYLVSNGVSEEDADALIDDESVEAAARIRDLLMESMPDGEGVYDSIVKFAMVPCPEDGATFDGVSWAKMHRGRTTLNSKHGKKNVVTHRAKWRKATAMQRASLRKNSRRAHTSAAKMMNRKSNLRTRKMGGRRVF